MTTAARASADHSGFEAKARRTANGPRSFVGPDFIGLDKCDVADFQGLGKLVQRDDGGIPPPAFKVAQILLAEPGPRLDVFLRQALFPTQTREIPTDQFAHVHAVGVGVYTLLVYQL